jgi:hypothetical protein
MVRDRASIFDRGEEIEARVAAAQRRAPAARAPTRCSCRG